MDAYERIYKGPKSPFTPLEPLKTNVFTFDSKSSNHNVSSRTSMLKTPKAALTKSNFLTPNKPTVRSSNLTPSTLRTGCLSSKLSITPVKSFSKIPVIAVTPNTGTTNLNKSTSLKTCITPAKSVSKLPVTTVNRTPSYQSRSTNLTATTNKSLPVAIRTPTNSSFGNTFNGLTSTNAGSNDMVSYKSKVECVKYDGKNMTKYCVENSVQQSKDQKISTSKMYKVSSPVPPRKLCPKMERTLKDIGRTNYSKLFEKEEIDYDTFQHFTENDLIKIGITSRTERNSFLTALGTSSYRR